MLGKLVMLPVSCKLGITTPSLSSSEGHHEYRVRLPPLISYLTTTVQKTFIYSFSKYHLISTIYLACSRCWDMTANKTKCCFHRVYKIQDALLWESFNIVKVSILIRSHGSVAAVAMTPMPTSLLASFSWHHRCLRCERERIPREN